MKLPSVRRSKRPDETQIPPMIGIDAKRWAQRADSLQYAELANLRSVAQNWRTGLAGLTSLLSVTSLIAVPGLSDRLSQPLRLVACGLIVTGLMALLFGTWQAMTAAFGIPGRAAHMTGERLRLWESGATRAGASALGKARTATAVGLLLIVMASAVVILGSAGPAPSPLVRAETVTAEFCGRVGDSDEGQLVVIGGDGTVHRMRIADVRSLLPAVSC